MPFYLPRETEDNAYAKFWGDQQIALWYVMVFLEWSILILYLIETVSGFSLSLELAQGLDTDKINPYIEKCFGIKKDLLTVRK